MESPAFRRGEDVNGWFLNQASRASYGQVVMRDILEGLTVGRLMQSDPPVVSPDITLEKLVDDYLLKSDARAFPVLTAGRLVGLISLDDVRRTPRAEWTATEVGAAMTAEDRLAIVAPADDAADAAELMSQRGISQVPVVHNGDLVGLLRRRDIVRWLELNAEGDLP